MRINRYYRWFEDRGHYNLVLTAASVSSRSHPEEEGGEEQGVEEGQREKPGCTAVGIWSSCFRRPGPGQAQLFQGGAINRASSTATSNVLTCW
ncbi:hypothetical protein PG985_011162 [Apiospora marii]|uniref:uncharacterized protein n=1 Tax=Apiospora marii TaxID=335849 RepID=UPI0031328C49